MLNKLRHYASYTFLAIIALSGLCAFAQPTVPITPTTLPTSQPASQPTRLDATDAAAITNSIGRRVVIVGRVSAAKLSSTGKVFRIEFEGVGSSGFLAVIFDRSLKAFEGALGSDLAKALEGKRVEVSGTLESYKGKPELILAKADQIKVLPE